MLPRMDHRSVRMRRRGVLVCLVDLVCFVCLVYLIESYNPEELATSRESSTTWTVAEQGRRLPAERSEDFRVLCGFNKSTHAIGCSLANQDPVLGEHIRPFLD